MSLRHGLRSESFVAFNFQVNATEIPSKEVCLERCNKQGGKKPKAKEAEVKTKSDKRWCPLGSSCPQSSQPRVWVERVKFLVKAVALSLCQDLWTSIFMSNKALFIIFKGLSQSCSFGCSGRFRFHDAVWRAKSTTQSMALFKGMSTCNQKKNWFKLTNSLIFVAKKTHLHPSSHLHTHTRMHARKHTHTHTHTHTWTMKNLSGTRKGNPDNIPLAGSSVQGQSLLSA